MTAFTGIAIPEREINGRKIQVEAEDNAQVLLDFGSGCLGVVTSGFTMQQYRNPALEVYGTTGTLQMLGDDWDPDGYELWQNSAGCWQCFKETDPDGRIPELLDVVRDLSRRTGTTTRGPGRLSPLYSRSPILPADARVPGGSNNSGMRPIPTGIELTVCVTSLSVFGSVGDHWLRLSMHGTFWRLCLKPGNRIGRVRHWNCPRRLPLWISRSIRRRNPRICNTTERENTEVRRPSSAAP